MTHEHSRQRANVLAATVPSSSPAEKHSRPMARRTVDLMRSKTQRLGQRLYAPHFLLGQHDFAISGDEQRFMSRLAQIGVQSSRATVAWIAQLNQRLKPNPQASWVRREPNG